MKTSALPVFMLLLAAAMAPAAHALPGFDSTALASADTDVNKDGTTALAFDFYNVAFGGTLTVNDVLFSADKSQNGVTLTLTGFTSSADNGDNQVGAMSADYSNLLLYNNYVQSSTATPTLKLSGLKTGHTYELELFDGSSFVNGTTTLQDGSASGTIDYGHGTNDTESGADFTTETFVAGPSQMETVTYSADVSNYLIVNAVDLRDLGVIPEPSTYALLLSGLAFPGLRLRRKSTV